MSALQPRQFQQLPLFMTAQEITDQYSPYHGDRRRIRPNLGDMPEHLTKPRRQKMWERKNTRLETEDELYGRKYEESVTGQSRIRDHMVDTPGIGPRPLRDALVDEGVRYPIHLGTKVGPAADRPEVLGGHHRLAVMREERPDELMPVLHHKSLYAAQNDRFFGGYR